MRAIKMLLMLAAVAAPTFASTDLGYMSYQREPLAVSSGSHSGARLDHGEIVVAFREVLEIPDALWMQLTFGDCSLGERSFLTITSLKDGREQVMDATCLDNWRHRSALFNGNAVEIALHVAHGDRDVFLNVIETRSGNGSGEEGGDRSLCGPDDRTPSDDLRVGRITSDHDLEDRFAFATGWIVSNGACLTAGHAVNDNMNILEFHIPSSDTCGNVVFSDPEHQYPIDPASIVWEVDGGEIGNDWAVFACSPNDTSGSLPVHAQGAYFRMDKDIFPIDVRVTGCGRDSTPGGCDGSYNEDHRTLQAATGPFEGEDVEGPNDVIIGYIVDTMKGGSGSPVIDVETHVTIGIHTNAGCDGESGMNRGTGFKNGSLEQAISLFTGENAVFVDAGHPNPLEEGTIFRPCATVTLGESLVPDDGILSIVEGHYSESITFSRAMRVEAPVGIVRIGTIEALAGGGQMPVSELGTGIAIPGSD